LLLSFIKDIVFMPLSIGVAISIAAMLMLLLVSSLVSGSELAFFSLSPAQIKLLKNKKSKTAEIILKHLESPHNLLATILVSNNFFKICIIMLSTYILEASIVFTGRPYLGFVFQVAAATFLILLFGEIMPKIYASQNSLRFSFIMARPLKLASSVLRPINMLLISSSMIIDRRVKRRHNAPLDGISQALDLTQRGMEDEKMILSSIMRLQKTYVTEIMRSRLDVVSASVSLSFEQVKELVKEHGYSRVPVFVDTIDNIKGILYVKDLIPHLDKSPHFSWQSLIRPPYYIPDTKKTDSLLEEFQKRRIHMAIVVDEYGGTAGLVTLEDIIEEIVGEINDENDDTPPEYLKLNEHTYVFEGKYLLIDFCKLYDIPSDLFDSIKGEADTLAGLILEIKGDFPELYEEIQFKNFTFKIESEDKRRIKRIKVIKSV
jgi:putative hemolysin